MIYAGHEVGTNILVPNIFPPWVGLNTSDPKIFYTKTIKSVNGKSTSF